MTGVLTHLPLTVEVRTVVGGSTGSGRVYTHTYDRPRVVGYFVKPTVVGNSQHWSTDSFGVGEVTSSKDLNSPVSCFVPQTIIGESQSRVSRRQDSIRNRGIL